MICTATYVMFSHLDWQHHKRPCPHRFIILFISSFDQYLECRQTLCVIKNKNCYLSWSTFTCHISTWMIAAGCFSHFYLRLFGHTGAIFSIAGPSIIWLNIEKLTSIWYPKRCSSGFQVNLYLQIKSFKRRLLTFYVFNNLILRK